MHALTFFLHSCMFSLILEFTSLITFDLAVDKFWHTDFCIGHWLLRVDPRRITR